MKPTEEQLTAAFEKATAEGPASLTGADRDYYLIQDFILEYEDGGLSGYFYNHVPELDQIKAAVDSMKRHELTDLAEVLGGAMKLFENYEEPDRPVTWRGVLNRCDPDETLPGLDHRIRELPNYGLME